MAESKSQGRPGQARAGRGRPGQAGAGRSQLLKSRSENVWFYEAKCMSFLKIDATLE